MWGLCSAPCIHLQQLLESLTFRIKKVAQLNGREIRNKNKKKHKKSQTCFFRDDKLCCEETEICCGNTANCLIRIDDSAGSLGECKF